MAGLRAWDAARQCSARPRRVRLTATGVLVVGDLLEPGCRGIDVHRQMDHQRVGCGAVPVTLSWFDASRAAGQYLLNRFTLLLETATPFDHQEQLWAGMRVPGRSCASLERHTRDVDIRVFVDPVYTGQCGLTGECARVGRSRGGG